MAISKKIGQDSEGVPIYKLDEDGLPTKEIDHDLDEIANSFDSFKKGDFKDSEYHFSVNKSELGANYKLNPQAYMPSLNETLRVVNSIDEKEGWSVTTIGQLSKDVKIFKGPRLKSEDLNVDDNSQDTAEVYYTPSAILQGKPDSVKYLNLGKASVKQKETIKKLRLQRGMIVVTRSGSIGRAAFITTQHDNVIASDDLIRIYIPDEKLRLYVYFYLLSQYAQDQMKMNEYGSIQQHLEPYHISQIVIPVPDDLSLLDATISAAENYIKRIEESFVQREMATSHLGSTLAKAINKNAL